MATIPIAAFIFVAGTLLGSPKGVMGDLHAGGYALVLLGGVAQLVGYVLLVAMASRVFQALAQRVLPAPDNA